MSEQMFAGLSMEQIESGTLSEFHAIQVLARRLPKAELHIHFSGAVRPSFPFPTAAERAISQDYVDAADFFARLRRVSTAFTDTAMFEAATLRILEDNVDCGCRHVEMFITPGEFDDSPVDMIDGLRAIGRAFEHAKRVLGLSGGIILETDRAADPAAGLAVVALGMAARDAGVPVLGIGNDGAMTHPVIAFAPAFEYAKREGFKTTCHLDTLPDVIEGLQLPLDRADHAFELKGRPDLIARYREARISITSAPASVAYMLPGFIRSPAEHPIDEFRLAGLRTSVCTDDPAFFHTDLAQDYVLVQQSFGWSRRTMAEMALASLEMAWIDEPDREDRLTSWRAEAEGMLADPRRIMRE